MSRVAHSGADSLSALLVSSRMLRILHSCNIVFFMYPKEKIFINNDDTCLVKMSAQPSPSERENRMIKRTSQREQEANNPCLKEHFLSLRCLESNQNKRNKCELYFLNYRNCRDFWATVQNDRRSKGIRPYLPSAEERAKIKADYLDAR